MSVRVSMVPSVAMSVQKNFLMIANIKTFSIKSCHIYKKDKNGCVFLEYFWIRCVQNKSNLIKLAQIGFLTNQKMFLYKVVTFTNWIKMAIFFGSDWIRSVQNGLNLTKLVQIGLKKIKMDHVDYLVQIR